MPAAIAKALLKAVKEVKEAEKTGKLEKGGREVAYHSIDDIYGAVHEAMIANDLMVKAVEVDCTEELLPDGVNRWAKFRYKFRFLHTSGTWTDEEDLRTIPIIVGPDGVGYGAAQTFALREFYRGLFRLRTGNGDQNPGAAASDQAGGSPAAVTSREQPDRAPKGKVFMTFPSVNNLAPILQAVSPQEALDLFLLRVASLKGDKVIEWARVRVNEDGLRQLQTLSPSIWKKIRHGVEVHETPSQDENGK
jgi:hypothetical protein